VLFAFIGVAAWWWVSRERPIEVQTVTVSSRGAGTQAAVLNATGYVLYALAMGLIGGLFPAIRAARLPIPVALREL